jgi:hypothetical protein
MGTRQLHGHLKQHWAAIKQQLLEEPAISLSR